MTIVTLGPVKINVSKQEYDKVERTLINRAIFQLYDRRLYTAKQTIQALIEYKARATILHIAEE